MAEQQQPVIIIRKKKGGGHAGHHGGAWKVAYADFVTAMMAFFLLMWLLNVTTSDQRKGLAEYFAPVGLSISSGGSGGVGGGFSITTPDGARLSDSSPPGTEDRALPSAGNGEEGDESGGKANDAGGGAKAGGAKGGNALTDKITPANMAEAAAALADAMKKEDAHFKEAEAILKQALSDTPGLKDLAQSILIDRTPEGLRIQIIDRDKFTMFPSGGAVPYERGRDLMRLVGKVIARLPNQISVTGHTDNSPFPMGSRRDNWDLSTERANVSRGELQVGGVDAARIARVSGLSDRDPLDPQNPNDPKNRRISIVLLRMAGPQAAAVKNVTPASAQP